MNNHDVKQVTYGDSLGGNVIFELGLTTEGTEDQLHHGFFTLSNQNYGRCGACRRMSQTLSDEECIFDGTRQDANNLCSYGRNCPTRSVKIVNFFCNFHTSFSPFSCFFQIRIVLRFHQKCLKKCVGIFKNPVLLVP